MLELKLNHVSKTGHWMLLQYRASLTHSSWIDHHLFRLWFVLRLAIILINVILFSAEYIGKILYKDLIQES